MIEDQCREMPCDLCGKMPDDCECAECSVCQSFGCMEHANAAHLYELVRTHEYLLGRLRGELKRRGLPEREVEPPDLWPNEDAPPETEAQP